MKRKKDPSPKHAGNAEYNEKSKTKDNMYRRE